MPTIDELTGPGYVDGLANLPMADLRSRRDECQQAGEVFSYLRRQIQGRLDFVHAEIDRRATGERADASRLVEELKQGKIMIDRSRLPGVGRLTLRLEVVDDDGWITREMDGIVPPGQLAAVGDMGEEQLRRVAADLAALETKVSNRRAQLHRRIDELQAELVRRYRDGEATVDSLLD